MSRTDSQYQRLMRFLDAEMERDEMIVFKAELDASPELREQLRFERDLRDNLALQPEWTERLKKIPATEEEPAAPVLSIEKRNAQLNVWLAVGIAASIVVAVAAFFMYWNPTANPTPLAHQNDSITSPTEKKPGLVVAPPKATPDDSSKAADLKALYSQYYQKDRVPDEVPIQLIAELDAFAAGNPVPIMRWQYSERSGPNEEDAVIETTGRYYKGLAFLETGQPQKAISELQWVVGQTTDKELMAKAEWYAALGYLKTEEKEKAVELLKKVSVRKNRFQLQAKALLENAELL